MILRIWSKPFLGLFTQHSLKEAQLHYVLNYPLCGPYGLLCAVSYPKGKVVTAR